MGRSGVHYVWLHPVVALFFEAMLRQGGELFPRACIVCMGGLCLRFPFQLLQLWPTSSFVGYETEERCVMRCTPTVQAWLHTRSSRHACEEREQAVM